jgi:hypothetical protein
LSTICCEERHRQDGQDRQGGRDRQDHDRNQVQHVPDAFTVDFEVFPVVL